MNNITINTRHLGAVEVDFDALSADVQQYIVAYGLKQSIDDAGASPDKAAAGSRERLAALKAGQVPAGRGGGKRLDDVEREVRSMVKDMLTQCGMKAGEADKTARDAEAGLAVVIRMQLAKARGVSMAAVADEDVDVLVDTNMEAIVAKAEETVANRKTGLSLDLDI